MFCSAIVLEQNRTILLFCSVPVLSFLIGVWNNSRTIEFFYQNRGKFENFFLNFLKFSKFLTIFWSFLGNFSQKSPLLFWNRLIVRTIGLFKNRYCSVLEQNLEQNNTIVTYCSCSGQVDEQ